MKMKLLGFMGIAAALYAVPAVAHHSFAMFDAEKQVTLVGTVKEFQWVNPHAWLIIVAPDAEGKAQVWNIEMGGPGGLSRFGWKRDTVKPGDKVTAVIHPLRDGKTGGQYLSVTLPDGKKLGDDKPV